MFPDEKTRALVQRVFGDFRINDYTWHNNRHTFCSWLAMAGASIKEIQEAAGHKTIQMAARVFPPLPQNTLHRSLIGLFSQLAPLLARARFKVVLWPFR